GADGGGRAGAVGQGEAAGQDPGAGGSAGGAVRGASALPGGPPTGPPRLSGGHPGRVGGGDRPALRRRTAPAGTRGRGTGPGGPERGRRAPAGAAGPPQRGRSGPAPGG